MIDKSFIEKIESMAETRIIEVNALPYSTKPLHPVHVEMQAIGLSTLQGLADFIREVHVAAKEDFIHIESPFAVSLKGGIGDFLSRQTYAKTTYCPLSNTLARGVYVPVEDFVVGMQTEFVQDENTAAILCVVGNISDGNIKAFSDDGVSQEVTARSGISKVANVKVPNPVMLTMNRTFNEIEQVPSLFVLRMKSGGSGLPPSCALFDASGGAWKSVAAERIYQWLKANVSDLPIVR